MRRDGNIASYAADELDEMLRNGEDLTDRKRVKAAVDFEDEGYFDRETAIPVSINLSGKKRLTIRLDGDILDWFKAQGSGY